MNTTTSYPSSQPHHGYLDGQHSHLAHGHHQHSAQSYPHYHQSAHIMQPHVSSYGHPPPHYAYGPPMASPHPGPHHYATYTQPHHPISLPAMSAAPAPPAPASEFPERVQDTTGQVSPPGVKPKVTATVWEDEGTLCFQVEADGVCVARREDNHMINGTKLLNVARMTRGRRDGILKGEKVRNVVKIGPMHLKGVWIPYERALEFANKEKITEKLYPLFVHNVGALLHQPVGQHVAARRADTNTRSSQTPAVQTPSQTNPSTQNQSIPTPGSAQTSQAPHSGSSHQTSGRPSLDRAHTYPTPPNNNSATGMLGMGTTAGSYEFTGGATSASPNQGLVDSKSLPTTPTNTTPPDSTVANLQQYPYDSSRHSYTMTSSQQSTYVPVTQSYSYAKGDMAPPPRSKDEDVGGRGVNPSDRQYSYGSGVGSVGHLDHNVSPSDMKPSQSHSGRTTPRTLASTPQGSWDAYHSQPPQRAQTLPSQNITYVPGVPDPRSADGTGLPNGYTASGMPMNSMYGYPNGSGLKRQRDHDDVDDYSMPAHSHDHESMKRRKIGGDDGSVILPGKSRV